MVSSFSTPSFSDSTDADYVLGQTGKTVVYIFPTGDALMNRDAATAPATLVEHQRKQGDPTVAQQPEKTDAVADTASANDTLLVDDLLAAGKLTVAQIQVARYDQSVTGLSLKEALILRGWL